MTIVTVDDAATQVRAGLAFDGQTEVVPVAAVMTYRVSTRWWITRSQRARRRLRPARTQRRAMVIRWVRRG